MYSRELQTVEEPSEGNMNVPDPAVNSTTSTTSVHQAGETSGGGWDGPKFVINIPDPEKHPTPTPTPPALCSRDVPDEHELVERSRLVSENWKGMFAQNRGPDRPLVTAQPLRVVFNMEEPKSRMEKIYKSLDDALIVVEDYEAKIQRIPFIMDKRNNGKNYEPRMVSIGPFYHKSSPNFDLTEKMKLKLAALFIEEHGLHKVDLYSKIKGEIEDLRSCYEENTWFDDDDLSWIFLVDGCAVLHYIHCATNKKNNTRFTELKIKVDYLTFMQHDLFLLENQIPFRVLELLMSCLNNENEMRESIEKFIFDSIKAPGEKQEQLEYKLCQNEIRPIHLLDLLRTRLLQSTKENQMPCSITQQIIKKVAGFIREPLEKFQNLIECIGKTLENSSCQQTQGLHFFRSVQELKAAGIRLRPSNTGHLTDVTFNLGTLKLPPIIIDDSTASKFLNLIAYEMCPDFINDFGVSSYVVFLDALIDQAQDVKELRDKQILHNALGSDEEVAALFNVIGFNLVSNPEKYSNIKWDIEKRYNNKWMTWTAQFIHRHFQSPWSVLAFIAAIIVLASTLIQTVYTVLGYYQ